MKRLLSVSIILVIIDQVIKYIVMNYMHLHESITLIQNFFKITYAQNTGAAWSIFSGNRLLLILIAFLSLWLLYHYCLKERKLNALEITTYGLLIGGIIGNLLDRIIHGFVIDYLDFQIFSYDYPIFNLADICIVLGVILLIYEILGGEQLWKRIKYKKNK